MTAYERQDSDSQTRIRNFTFNPWNVQNVVYELVKLNLLRSNPLDDGFIIPEKYDVDPNKSQIYLGISYDWKSDKSSKRPAIFIQRDTATANISPIRQTISTNTAESITTKLAITGLPIYVKVIGTDVGTTEQLATWIRANLLTYQLEIQQDFAFRQFRVTAMTAPRVHEEAKENFEITIVINTIFDENFKIQQDALRLKTISANIYDAIGQPFTNQ